jgi:hypothetical protein
MIKKHIETKISAENAEKIFLEIKKAFGFNVKESKVRKITLDIKGNKAETTEEYDPLTDILSMIQDGKVEFNAEKTVIKFNLSKPIESKDGSKFGCLEVGVFTRNKQKRVGNLSDMAVGSMKDEELDELFSVMTGVSDADLFGEMLLPEFLQLRSIAILFFE